MHFSVTSFEVEIQLTPTIIKCITPQLVYLRLRLHTNIKLPISTRRISKYPINLSTPSRADDSLPTIDRPLTKQTRSSATA